jgi:hypothetical protein
MGTAPIAEGACGNLNLYRKTRKIKKNLTISKITKAARPKSPQKLKASKIGKSQNRKHRKTRPLPYKKRKIANNRKTAKPQNRNIANRNPAKSEIAKSKNRKSHKIAKITKNKKIAKFAKNKIAKSQNRQIAKK